MLNQVIAAWVLDSCVSSDRSLGPGWSTPAAAQP